MDQRLECYANELADYLEACGDDGTTVGLSDAALCARALREYSRRRLPKRVLACAVALPAVVSATFFGDLNGDGRVDMKDLTILSSAIVSPVSAAEGTTPNPLRLARPAWAQCLHGKA